MEAYFTLQLALTLCKMALIGLIFAYAIYLVVKGNGDE